MNACGKLPTSRPRARVVFLAQQSDIVAQREQPVEQRPRVRKTVLQDIGIDQPEAAGEEGALPRRQAVIGRRGVVAHHETVFQQAPLDCLDRADDARIVGGQESDARQQQQAGIELLRFVADCTKLPSSRSKPRRQTSA